MKKIIVAIGVATAVVLGVVSITKLTTRQKGWR